MNGTAFLFLALTVAFAVGDWVAVAMKIKALEYVAKPATMVMLLGGVLALDPTSRGAQICFVAALFFSLVGDIFLMLPDDRLFVGGLASFFVAHVAYVVGFWVAGVSVVGLAIGAVVVAVALVALGRRIVQGVREAEPSLAMPVMAYIGVISLMVASAFGRGAVLAVVGSLLFYASDALIAWNRFLHEYPWGRMAIIITYHAGQVGLVLSLA